MRFFVLSAMMVCALGFGCVAASGSQLEDDGSPAPEVEGSALALQAVVPQLDIEGFWQADVVRPMQCFRIGADVTCIMNNPGFAHLLTGFYITPTVVYLDVTRRNRGNGCVTHLNVLVTLLSSNTFTLTWTARDSNCDLTLGQTGTDPLFTRIN